MIRTNQWLCKLEAAEASDEKKIVSMFYRLRDILEHTNILNIKKGCANYQWAYQHWLSLTNESQTADIHFYAHTDRYGVVGTSSREN